jgi:hypothetical protein
VHSKNGLSQGRNFSISLRFWLSLLKTEPREALVALQCASSDCAFGFLHSCLELCQDLKISVLNKSYHVFMQKKTAVREILAKKVGLPRYWEHCQYVLAQAATLKQFLALQEKAIEAAVDVLSTRRGSAEKRGRAFDEEELGQTGGKKGGRLWWIWKRRRWNLGALRGWSRLKEGQGGAAGREWRVSPEAAATVERLITLQHPALLGVRVRSGSLLERERYPLFEEEDDEGCDLERRERGSV